MNRVYQNGASNNPPAAPQQPSIGYPTNGDQGTNTPATEPGDYWFHQVTESLVNVIEGAGLTPDHTDLNQLLKSIKMMSNSSVRTTIGSAQLHPEDGGTLYVSGNITSNVWLPLAADAPGVEYKIIVTTKDAMANVAVAAGDTIDGGASPHFVDSKSILHLKSDGVDMWRRFLTVPVGSLIQVVGTALPAGWFNCNGEAISRSFWPRLFDELGEVWGAGDGSTTFNLPDFRGEFIRGFDDGRGVDPGRIFGSYQLDSIQNITGSVDGLITGVLGVVGPADGALDIIADSSTGGFVPGTAKGVSVDFDASRSVRTSDETRPRNGAVLYGVKY